MNIQGLQKTTLLDYPDKVACMIFTGGCNFRCPYCHNSELINVSGESMVDKDELFRFLNKRKGLLDGVVITGGEPLIHNDIDSFIADIKSLGYLVKLDTNGSFPERLKSLIDNNLVDYVAMDVKNCRESYAKTVGVDVDISKIEKSVEILKEGRVEYEFRTTLVNELHNEQDINSIGEWLCGAEKLYLQSFVDSDNVAYSGFHAPDKATMQHYMQILVQFVRFVKIRN